MNIYRESTLSSSRSKNLHADIECRFCKTFKAPVGRRLLHRSFSYYFLLLILDKLNTKSTLKHCGYIICHVLKAAVPVTLASGGIEWSFRLSASVWPLSCHILTACLWHHWTVSLLWWMFQVKVPTETRGYTEGRKSRVGLHHWLHFIMDKEYRLYIVYNASFIHYIPVSQRIM